ncbi:MFS transporter [Microterricola viridarii]|uniref:Predicted arabinose efflux permease, MFS family n=1 Tax=Microterricola viridarii TaxID=412690 RepID=A0A1H1Z6W8_9MICO|nr:MFS transporter [Microterricola viridarii]SDT29511.1 Predicted arabinose efflux permease, MFS family [Microterricola viridarii]
MQSLVIRGVSDVVSFIDARPRISGRAAVIWWLALSGLFLDAFSNSALSAGLGPMTRDMELSATQVAILTSLASWVAIVFNPIGGWLADRWGRIPPLLFAKLLALIGAALAAFAPTFEMVLAGRFFVGAAYGIDFAIAMALLAEFTPARFKARLNTWQGIWYVAVSTNLILAIGFYNLGVGDSIWRFAVGSAGVVALVLLVLQAVFMVESPTWLARKEKLERAARSMTKIYGEKFTVAAVADRIPVLNQATRGIANVALIFRGTYRQRTILAATVQMAQSIQYFAVGWYLPIISLTLFGADFVVATLGALVFNLFGVFGGFMSPVVGKKLGLRRASAVGFGAVFVMLVILGFFYESMPIWLAFIVPSLFILFHSAGPGANGKSLSTLSFRSELRAGANGIIGAIGSMGAALGLLIFPLLKEGIGLGPTFLILSAVPLAAFIICSVIKWDPTRATVSPDEETNAPQFKSDAAAQARAAEAAAASLVSR